ncbi:MAG TPA: arylsulfatase [Tepidisphaeraceae bacterium]|jgi:arylsulfatase A-like enzyme|nr:arylsulfatase [Tepidisphaeraceae bacterium]
MPHSNDISRRELLQAGAGALAGATLGGLTAARASGPAKPNIVFIMDDQHRGDALGVAGNHAIQTPNLDRLAAEGAYFAKAYASVPSCPPARASILTGLTPWQHGMLGYTEQATRWPYVMPRAMTEAGYQTHAIGKNHFNPWRNPRGYQALEIYDGLPITDGVDDYGIWLKKTAPGVDEHSTHLGWNDRRAMPWPHRPELHPTAWVGQRAVDFIKGYRSDRPFFLKVSFHRPHSPFDPPAHWWEHYEKVDLPKAAVGDWAEKWFGSFTPPRSPDAARANLPASDIRETRRGYYAAISFVDEQIGRVVDALQSAGFSDNTLILFVADHGEMAGDHHLWRKTYAYEGSAHIPMLAHWGNEVLTAKRGQVFMQLTELRDVFPTCLDAAGLTPASPLAGRSLLDLVRGKPDGWRRQLDLEHSTCYWKESPWTALTDGTFKYIFYAYTGNQQLFDLSQDPAEVNDLSDDPAHAATLKQWRQKMVAHLSERGPQWVNDDDLVLRQKPMHRGRNFPELQTPPAQPAPE